jgi:hypothetical protein
MQYVLAYYTQHQATFFNKTARLKEKLVNLKF